MIKFINQLLYLIQPYGKKELFKIVFLMIIGGAIETIGIGIILPFVSILNDPQNYLNEQGSKYIGFIDQFSLFQDKPADTLLVYICISLILLFLSKNIFLALINFSLVKFISNSQIHLSRRLFQQYIYSPYTFHLQRNSADIISYVLKEVGQVYSGVIAPGLVLITELIVVTFVFILLLFVEPLTSITALVILSSTIILFNSYIKKKISQLGAVRRVHAPKIIRAVNQALGGLKETKVLGREAEFVHEFNRHISTSINSDLLANFARQTPSLFIETVILVSVVLIVLLVIVEGRSTQSVFPLLSLFAIAALRIMPSAKRISSTLPLMNYYKHSVDIIYKELRTLDTELKTLDTINTRIDQSFSKTKQNLFQNSISFRNVTYSYPNSNIKAINSISFKIQKNSSVAFVGMSGSGKTTLVDILLGLLKPDQGEIYIDDITASDNLREWQNKIGYIPQNIFLSDETIKKNIAFGIPDERICEEKVWSALRLAQLEEYVQDQTDQINTLVGERGVRLSGGQRQRIGIARALYHNPDVLVMDEATAALDNTTEREFIRALEDLVGKKTLVFIAHRLTTIEKCDQIFLLNKGKIIASGDYSELLNKSPEFKDMAQIMNK